MITPETCRFRAEELRTIADCMGNLTIARQIIRLASQYDQLALDIENNEARGLLPDATQTPDETKAT